MDTITMNVSEKKILRTKPLLRTKASQIFLKYYFCSLESEKMQTITIYQAPTLSTKIN